MTTITPFLWFGDGKMNDAIAFYRSVFKDAEVISQNPMGAEFSLVGQRFMALNAGPAPSFSEAISLFISCKDQSEVDYYWNALIADGGAESMCGWCKDKYGVSWQVIPEALGRALGNADANKRQRAMNAMLQMKKINVAELEAAVAG